MIRMARCQYFSVFLVPQRGLLWCSAFGFVPSRTTSFRAVATVVLRSDNRCPSAMQIEPLAVIGEIRYQVKSIQDRCTNYLGGPETFRTLNDNADRLDKHIEEIDKLLSASPDTLPAGISVIFHDTLAEVCGIVKKCPSDYG